MIMIKMISLKQVSLSFSDSVSERVTEREIETERTDDFSTIKAILMVRHGCDSILYIFRL